MRRPREAIPAADRIGLSRKANAASLAASGHQAPAPPAKVFVSVDDPHWPTCRALWPQAKNPAGHGPPGWSFPPEWLSAAQQPEAAE